MGENLANGEVEFFHMLPLLRTNDSLKRQLDVGHHRGTAILTHLPIDSIKVALLNYMQLVCLDAAKKLIILLVSGQRRQGPVTRDEMPYLNVSLQNSSRKPRSFSQLNRWKATEFLLFLLHTGPVILN